MALSSVVLREGKGFAEFVIPGRATRVGASRRPSAGSGANPESSFELGILGWSPGPTLRVVPE
ncbi:hypothetical protein PQJ75_28715 [Rhodoplanes sp. TEM]|uniref:Uncharacterized protein n=1 Tax=Rhodoplanes tepidamans TaxID=200616 RepID=A0ABT5JI14_RHOTP|nr:MULTISPECIES: hypothetical protein [Rhodoplanes]MDC7789361.1 hypothetical protein [Rhodoplanes tepidamans]MDC7987736.1 hypothetical protein [Rhodoplanes sp. TEM]MDQ0358480.1 hypothetical protein [Rhodoplanes tepidamans]